MAAVVVSDTSPVRALAHLKLLHVLPALFGRVLIPPAVLRELSNPPAGAVRVTAGELPFAEVRSPYDGTRLNQLLTKLDAGEAEALALAVEVQADLVVIDEAAGRRAAASLGLNYVGVLGVLVEAKRRGHISCVADQVDALQNGLGFFVGADVRQAILVLAGEALP